MCDASYTNYVHNFLNNPYMLHIYGNESISAMKIFREVFQPDICEFYKIADFFSSKCALNQLLEVFDFDAESHTLSGRRTFVEIPKSLGYPDGFAMDEQDHIWLGLWNGNAIL